MPVQLVRPSDYLVRLLPRLQDRFLPLHSQFERSANLAPYPFLLIALTSPALGLSPFGLAAREDLAPLLPELSRAGGLRYHDGHFWAGSRTLLALAPDPPYRTQLEPSSPVPGLAAASFHQLLAEASPGPRKGLAELLASWEPGGSIETTEQLSGWVHRAAPAIAQFRSAPASQIAQAARRLIGLGLGLTPSGDDFLLGFVAARTAQSAEDEVRSLRIQLAHHAMKATPLVSATYLRHGLQGRFSSHLKQLLDLLHSPRCSPEATRLAIDQVIRVGSTSGRDALMGLLMGLYRHEQQKDPVSPC